MHKSFDCSFGGIFIAMLFVALTSTWTAADEVTEAKQPAAPKPLVTISKETTYYTEPLRPDGYVDYMAVANALASEGVTPENNAAVLLLKAFGPAEIGKEIRDQFQEKMGIDPLPDEGNYFVPFEEFVEAKGLKRKAQNKAKDDWDHCVSHPWKTKRYPLVAEWLTQNEHPISLMADASRCSRYYSPGIAGDDEPQVVCMILPVIVHTRTAARVLLCRAMLQAGNGEIDEAWNDVLAVHRLARSIGTGPTLIDGLVAIAIDAIASQGTATLAYHAPLTKEQATRFAGDLEKLPPMPEMVGRLKAERIMFLDAISHFARKGPNEFARSIDGLGVGNDRPMLAKIFERAGFRAIDWDVILRMGNQCYDRLEAAGSMPPGPKRKAAFNKLDEDLNARMQNAKDLKKLTLSLLAAKPPRKIVSESVGNIMLALFFPALNAVFDAETRDLANSRMEPVVLALSAYRAAEGEYPKKLDVLAPEFLAAIPRDPYIGEPIRYKRTRKGYVLYCVGPDGEDNGGRGRMSDSHEHDDIAFFAPPKKR